MAVCLGLFVYVYCYMCGICVGPCAWMLIWLPDMLLKKADKGTVVPVFALSIRIVSIIC